MARTSIIFVIAADQVYSTTVSVWERDTATWLLIASVVNLVQLSCRPRKYVYDRIKLFVVGRKDENRAR